MIELKDICIEYDRVILDHASISIPAHSITLIRGKSGSGKTALLYCISLMDTKSKYQYYYDHRLIGEKDRNNIRKECISYVLQENDLLAHLDVRGTLQYFAHIHNKHLSDKDIQDYLDKMHLDVTLNQNVMTLSLGERQRLSIATALVSNPQVLVLDEPTASLDHENEIEIYNILKELSTHMTIVLASHSEESMKYADVVYTLENNQLSVNSSMISDDPCGEGVISQVDHKFYKEYVKDYVKHYRFMYVLMMMVFILSLVSGQMILGIINHSREQGMQMLIGQLENKAIITKDKHSYVDQDYSHFIKIDDKNTFPLYKIYTQIEGEDVYLVPYFKDDDLSKYIDRNIQETKTGIYMDNESYYLLNQGLSDNRVNLDLYITDQKGMHQTTHTFDINGVFRNNKKVHYVSKSQRYIYVPYAILQDIYKQSGCTPRYIGYIIKTNTYNELNELIDYYESKGYRINDSFTDREAMNSLDSYYKNMMFTFAGVILVISVLIDIVLESHLLMQRKKELVLLLISGLLKKDLQRISMVETLGSISIVVVSSTLISSIMSLILGTFNMVTLSSMTVLFIIILLIERMVLQNKFINKLNIVDELRNEVH
ncbi:ATP-binding cassette domain-containing protein [Catenibacterium mitsuokai]|uniref:ATP-binding cassette domain-containing protein n=1 Tax=Catenibacterium mitsuokai TaxID=100886 RepID=UPI0012DFCCCC|nr:ATP-binding cassette domain-containing protein [Catenibacterium mitsuokai]UWO53333.1 ATP-binding cassette domain-containing protein [Catenibacterium mitsuokai]